MFDARLDAKVRKKAFAWLDEQRELHGDVLPYELLRRGFELGGRRVPLLGPKGIFKPALLDLPLSITTAPKGPYDDSFGPDGALRYRYRGTDPDHPDNRGLREAMGRQIPLVYLHGLLPGRYLPCWPAYVVRDEPDALTFTVEIDAREVALPEPGGASWVAEDAEPRRRYVTAVTRRRLHQQAFRERVLDAYRRQCAMCRLKHAELLDAAHIVPDSEAGGDPAVDNGLALCRLHHAAFDRFFLAVRPDRVIEVHPEILREKNGPTLRHAIQDLHGARILLPRRPEHRPAEARLERRYARFLEQVRSGAGIAR